MEGIKKLLLIGIGAFALMQLIKPHAVSAQEQVELPRSQVELPRSAQLLDIATVRKSINSIFIKTFAPSLPL